jgi:hypothetical protein
MCPAVIILAPCATALKHVNRLPRLPSKREDSFDLDYDTPFGRNRAIQVYAVAVLLTPLYLIHYKGNSAISLGRLSFRNLCCICDPLSDTGRNVNTELNTVLNGLLLLGVSRWLWFPFISKSRKLNLSL